MFQILRQHQEPRKTKGGVEAFAQRLAPAKVQLVKRRHSDPGGRSFAVVAQRDAYDGLLHTIEKMEIEVRDALAGIGCYAVAACMAASSRRPVREQLQRGLIQAPWRRALPTLCRGAGLARE